ncbi:MAG: hypothetical protein CR982_05270 [Candidatus Cloacimonadota bacterium]|nr:MAG: hypothetical protein CR982_05270 [Candidatus Cloacimonadota bacterium]PIE78452.1 MAG: hypothetical protein CSA15_07725 [Candidatus Delongbacteria bacterium]
MSYLVIARKYRPSNFEDVIGQDHVTQTLRNAIAQSKVHHAYIFTGPRGVGKTSVSRILAKALNCETGITSTPCGKCSNCIEIEQGNSMDVREIDGASNRSIDDVRELRDSIKFSPASCRKKIFIIDEVHMLTQQAFNALLKTLEEPPPHAMFIFATTEINEVPATILSRCQRFDFKRVNIETLKSALKNICDKENIEIDSGSLTTIAKAGDGSVRDSQSVLDRVIAYCGNKIEDSKTSKALGLPQFSRFINFFDIANSKDSGKLLLFVEEIISEGIHINTFLDKLLAFVRDLLLYQTTLSSNLLNLSEDNINELAKLSGKYNDTDLLIFLDILSKGIQALKSSTSARIEFELILLKIVNYESVNTLKDILEKLSNIDGDIEIPLNVSTNYTQDQPKENKEVEVKVLNPEQNIKVEVEEERDKEPKRLVENEHRKEIEEVKNLPKEEDQKKDVIDIVSIREKWKEFSNIIVEKDPFLREIWKLAVPLKFDNNCLVLAFDKVDKSFKSLALTKSEQIRKGLRDFYEADNLTIRFSVEEIDDSRRIFEVKRERNLTDEELKEELIKENSVFEYLFKEPFNCKIEK